MLPPVLEIVIVWHPQDTIGTNISEAIIEHFRGISFSGIIGGGIQITLRSCSWSTPHGAPRPIYTQQASGPNGITPPSFVAIVPLLGLELANAVENDANEWNSYLRKFVDYQNVSPEQIAIFPLQIDQQATNGTKLGGLIGQYQQIGTSTSSNLIKEAGIYCRDLAQGLVQFLDPDTSKRLTVFISHTKRSSSTEGKDVDELVSLVREVIGETRLANYFDANDLQPGTDWDNELRENAQQSALLCIRTDLYSSREWCQREVAIAKYAGMPVIMLDAISEGEERGSFLMDHVPRLPVKKNGADWQKSCVVSCLNLLVDECLKRVIWKHQKQSTDNSDESIITWWAPHAPEPITLLTWIDQNRETLAEKTTTVSLRILHPDPPLGADELSILQKQARLCGVAGTIDIITPRLLAARGG